MFPAVGVDGNFIYSVNFYDGLLSYSVDGDGSGGITHIDSDIQGGEAMSVWGDGNFIYVGYGETDMGAIPGGRIGGIHSYSVDGSGNLTHIDYDDGYGFARDVWGDGNFIYLTSDGDLHVYSVDGAGILTHIDSDVQSGYAYGVWGDGNFIYLAYSDIDEYPISGTGGLRVYSVDGAGNLTHIGSNDQGGGAVHVWGDGNFIYAGHSIRGVHVYSVDDSGNLTHIDSDDQGDSAGGVWVAPGNTIGTDVSDFLNNTSICTDVCAGNYQPNRFTSDQYQLYCPGTPSGFAKVEWGYSRRRNSDNCGDFFTQPSSGEWNYPSNGIIDYKVLKSPDHWNYIYQNPQGKCIDFRSWTFSQAQAETAIIPTRRIIRNRTQQYYEQAKANGFTFAGFNQGYGPGSYFSCCRYPQVYMGFFDLLPDLATCYYADLNDKKYERLLNHNREIFQPPGGTLDTQAKIEAYDPGGLQMCRDCGWWHFIHFQTVPNRVAGGASPTCWGAGANDDLKEYYCGFFGLDHLWKEGYYHWSWSPEGAASITVSQMGRPRILYHWRPTINTIDLCIDEWWDCQAQVMVRGCALPDRFDDFWRQNLEIGGANWGHGGGYGFDVSHLTWASQARDSHAYLMGLNASIGAKAQGTLGCIFPHRECYTDPFAPWTAHSIIANRGNPNRPFFQGGSNTTIAYGVDVCNGCGGKTITIPGELSTSYQQKGILFVPVPPSGTNYFDLNGCLIPPVSGNNYRFRYDHVTWQLSPMGDPLTDPTIYDCDGLAHDGGQRIQWVGNDITRHRHWILHKQREETRTFMTYSGDFADMVSGHGTGIFCTGMQIELPSEYNVNGSWTGFVNIVDACGMKNNLSPDACVYQKMDDGKLFKAETCAGPFFTESRIVVDYYKDHDYLAQTNWICLKDSFIITMPPEVDIVGASRVQMVAEGSKVVATRPYSQFRNQAFMDDSPRNHWYRNYYYVFDDTIDGTDIVDLYYQHDGKQFELSYCQCNPISGGA